MKSYKLLEDMEVESSKTNRQGKTRKFGEIVTGGTFNRGKFTCSSKYTTAIDLSTGDVVQLDLDYGMLKVYMVSQSSSLMMELFQVIMLAPIELLTRLVTLENFKPKNNEVIHTLIKARLEGEV